METSFAGNDVFIDRYPDLCFHLNYATYPQMDVEEINALKEACQLSFADVSLEKIDILYVFGVGAGGPYEALKPWLHEHKQARLIFIEEDLGAIAALKSIPELVNDPQVKIHYLSCQEGLMGLLEECVREFPSDRVDVLATASYQGKSFFEEVRLNVLRMSAVAHAVMTEALYSHKLLKNLLKNIKQWPGSFFANDLKDKFKGVPAIICGAGPSLGKTFEQLKEIEDRALIIAGGSTIAALSNHGVIPHLGLALDPNPEEYGRLKASSAYEMPMIYATRLQPDVFNTFNGERGYLISDTGGSCERYFERAMGVEGDPIGPELGAEALSVTTLAIALAVEMGCSPILLNGIDLAYTGMQRYAEGILPSSTVFLEEMQQETKSGDRLVCREGIQGHLVYTLVKWVMESECIAAYAKRHPKSRFVNVTEGGLGFAGVPNLSFAEAMDKELVVHGDLRGRVYAELQGLKMPRLFKDAIGREMQVIEESLMRLNSMAEEMLEELERLKSSSHGRLPSGKTTLLELDFQEEKAFECLFPTLGPALDRLLDRAYFFLPSMSEDEKRLLHIERQLAKWRQWSEIINAEIQIFSTH